MNSFQVGPNLEFSVDQVEQVICKNEQAFFKAQIGMDFDDVLEIDIQGLPFGATGNFNIPEILPGSFATLTINNFNESEAGIYQILLTTTYGSQTSSTTLLLEILENPSPIQTLVPYNNMQDVSLQAEFLWFSFNEGVHEIVIALDADFNDVVALGSSDDFSFQPEEYLLNGTEYFWSISFLNDCGYAETNIYNFKKEETLPEDVLIIYDTFSPNNDEKNDVYKIQGLDNYPNSELKIYNRWGHLVFEKTDAVPFWDGNFEGTNMPVGIYFFYLKLNGVETKSGFIRLWR